MAGSYKALFFLALVLCSTLVVYAARPEPAFSAAKSAKTELKGVETEQVDEVESCEGVGEEECLMRRTLAAHVDYIYTQKHNP
ncbi:phytosulfokines 3-like [Pyrus ussuriensis x Pyrus communis]|uniref:Phytosulfokine n=1 Tax=Pyrus ussuriensis x Pyrus communis TaxID=2448454 RepID=A0A5N5GRC9_9ROSA|nr:phytosulfokines 3-like [Pyrus x bretschneideri]KAB2617697.1 phytosulfokines 3-like [Pyrus ussuriensis x Pyrus communis]